MLGLGLNTTLMSHLNAYLKLLWCSSVANRLVFQLTHQHMVEMVFVLLKQSFPTDLACFGRGILINSACKNNGGFADTHVSKNQIDIMQQITVKNQSHS